uniref:Uncharacterized protein n=1 Tax=Ditylenchus dipsaci TaxID=166011 RepID=A0A915DNA2_9BILA
MAGYKWYIVSNCTNAMLFEVKKATINIVKQVLKVIGIDLSTDVVFKVFELTTRKTSFVVPIVNQQKQQTFFTVK